MESGLAFVRSSILGCADRGGVVFLGANKRTAMAPDFPPEVAVHSLRDDVTYGLPVRRLGSLRWIGLFFLLFGVGFTSGSGASLINSLKQAKSGNLPEIIFACFLVPFVAAGLMTLAIGLFILFGRA